LEAGRPHCKREEQKEITITLIGQERKEFRSATTYNCRSCDNNWLQCVPADIEDFKREYTSLTAATPPCFTRRALMRIKIGSLLADAALQRTADARATEYE
jgi:hypothetical protein